MAAGNKDDLLAVTRKEFAKLEKLFAACDERSAMAKDADDTSIKDVVAHRAHWIELKRYNADLRARQAGLGWAEAQGHLRAQHRKLVGFIELASDAELYGGPMAGAKNDWTPGRWAEASGPSHYRSACKYIRARQKALRRACGRAPSGISQ